MIGNDFMKNFITAIKNYSTENIIEVFAKISNKIFNSQNEKKMFPCCIELPILYYPIRSMPTMSAVGLSAWEIQHIQYLAIKHSSDYRDQTIKNEQELAMLVNLYRGYANKHSGAEKIDRADISVIFKYMFGVASEQFIYHNLSWVFQRFNRNYHILLGSDIISRPIDIDSIVKDRIGLSAEELTVAYFIIFWLCTQRPDILTAPEELYKKKTETVLTKANIERIVEYYTVSYKDVRESPLENLIFYSKPFVKTRKGVTLMTNSYLVFMLIADGLYWILRDFLQRNRKPRFY